MYNKLFYFTILCCLSAFALNAHSQAFYAMTYSPVIEGNAMGGAQTAMVDDYQAFFYNPAGLSMVQRGLFGYSRIIQDYDISLHHFSHYGGAAYRTKPGVVGVAVYSFNARITDEPTYNYRASQNSYQLSFARQIRKNMHLGISIKYLREMQEYMSSNKHTFSALSGDIGILINQILPHTTIQLNTVGINHRFKRNSFSGFSFGIALLNTGPAKAGFDNDIQFPLSQMLSLGMGYTLLQSDIINISTAIDLNKILVYGRNSTFDNFIKAWFTSWKSNGFDRLYSGMELNFYHFVSLYFGYKRLMYGNFEDEDTFTFGFSAGPDYARLAVSYHAYQTDLLELSDPVWNFGLNIAY